MYTQIDIDPDKSTHYDGEQFSREHKFVDYFKTSAKTGDGIEDAIQFMLAKVTTFRLTAI